jgi:Glucose-6-phosphate dehydrogenase, C-terminal domain
MCAGASGLLGRRPESGKLGHWDAAHGRGDLRRRMVFARRDEVEAAWRIVSPALGCSTPAHKYEPGTWDPPEADRLIARDGGWHCPSARAVAS